MSRLAVKKLDGVSPPSWRGLAAAELPAADEVLWRGSSLPHDHVWDAGLRDLRLLTAAEIADRDDLVKQRQRAQRSRVDVDDVLYAIIRALIAEVRKQVPTMPDPAAISDDQIRADIKVWLP